MLKDLPVPRKWVFGVVGWILLASTNTQSLEVTDSHLQSSALYYSSGVPTYIAGMYLDSPFGQLSSEKALEHTNVMAFKIIRSRLSSRSWGKELIQGAVINNSPELVAARAGSFKEFSSLLIEWLYEGDVLEIRREPKGLSIYVNNVELAYITDTELFSVFLRAWIGDVPPSSEFKTRLLTGSANDKETREFLVFSDEEDRKARALTWLALLNPVEEVLSGPKQNVLNIEDLSKHDEESKAELAQLSEFEKERARLSEKEAALKTLQAKIDEENRRRQEQEAIALEKQQQEAEMNEYTKHLFRHPNSFIRYPMRSQARREQGLVEVRIQINRAGEVVEAKLETSSDFQRLDNAALAAIQNASPFPSVPGSISGEVFEFVVPLIFRVQ
jgi:TonB family protein